MKQNKETNDFYAKISLSSAAWLLVLKKITETREVMIEACCEAYGVDNAEDTETAQLFNRLLDEARDKAEEELLASVCEHTDSYTNLEEL